MEAGTVIRANSKGFAFILDDSGRQLFVHRNAFVDQSFSLTDTPGRRVAFSPVRTPKGWKAEDVSIVDGDKGREHGFIETVCREFGFIRMDIGDQIYFHSMEIVDCDIVVGERVTLTIGLQDNGKTRALAVRREV